MAPSVLAASIVPLATITVASLAIVVAAFAPSFELTTCFSSHCYFSRLAAKATKAMLAFVKPSKVDPSEVKPSGAEPSGVDPSGVDPSGAEAFKVKPFRVASPFVTVSFASIAVFIAALTSVMAPFIVTNSSSRGSLDQSTKAVRMV